MTIEDHPMFLKTANRLGEGDVHPPEFSELIEMVDNNSLYLEGDLRGVVDGKK